MYIYVYIHMYREREREREIDIWTYRYRYYRSESAWTSRRSGETRRAREGTAKST